MGGGHYENQNHYKQLNQLENDCGVLAIVLPQKEGENFFSRP